MTYHDPSAPMDEDYEVHEGPDDLWIGCPNCYGFGHEAEGYPCEECDGAGGWFE